MSNVLGTFSLKNEEVKPLNSKQHTSFWKVEIGSATFFPLYFPLDFYR